MTPRILAQLLMRSFTDWKQHDATRLGASLAFYTILSMSPLFILAIAAASVVFSKSTVQDHLLAQVQSLAGPEGAEVLRSILISSQRKSSGIVATGIGIITLLFGASGVFAELRFAMNKIWDCNPTSGSELQNWIKERFFSIGMVISVGFVLLTSLLINTALEALTEYFGGLIPVPIILIEGINAVASFVGVAFSFGLILKYVPETTVHWLDVRAGALLTAFLFTVGKSLLGLYLGKTSPASAYGAAGSLVVLVIWVYYSAQIFFFGAEFTHVHALWKRGPSASPGSNAGGSLILPIIGGD